LSPLFCPKMLLHNNTDHHNEYKMWNENGRYICHLQTSQKPTTQSREKLARLYKIGCSKIKPVALIRKCLNKTCSKFRLCEHLPDALRIPNSLKGRNASFLLFLSFSLAQCKGKKNQDKLDANGTYQLLVYCDDVNSVDEKHKWHKGKQNLY
jgi:hypothetical protein